MTAEVIGECGAATVDAAVALLREGAPFVYVRSDAASAWHPWQVGMFMDRGKPSSTLWLPGDPERVRLAVLARAGQPE